MHAIILAGGFGTRLKPVVSDVPKPLAPIKGRPFLAWLIDSLIWYHVDGITLSVHHDWEKIRDYFENDPPKIPLNYAVEKKPLGTGGAIAYALKDCNVKEPVLVLNGDSFMRVDYRELYAKHQQSGSCLTMVLREVPDTGRYGHVMEKTGIVTAFGPGKAGQAGLINAGIYVMDPALFSKHKMPAAFSFEQDFLPSRLADLEPHAFKSDDFFIDIGIPEDYARACRYGIWRTKPRGGDFA